MLSLNHGHEQVACFGLINIQIGDLLVLVFGHFIIQCAIIQVFERVFLKIEL